MEAPICKVHNVPMKFRSGVSQKTGKPYQFYSCSVKNPDGSWCSEKANAGSPSSPATNTNKPDTSIRVAIAAACIQAGVDTGVAERWERWVKGVDGMDKAREAFGDKMGTEITPDDIPESLNTDDIPF